MADLIDRDALLKDMGLTDAVKYGNKDAEQQYRSYSTWMSYEIADSIWDAPTVNRWIPCSERLPDYYDDILFCERDRTIHKGYMYWDGTFIEHYVKFEKKDIVAWMPLPEPPKEDEA